MFIDARDVERAATGDSKLVPVIVNSGQARQLVEIKVSVQVLVAQIFVS